VDTQHFENHFNLHWCREAKGWPRHTPGGEASGLVRKLRANVSSLSALAFNIKVHNE